MTFCAGPKVFPGFHLMPSLPRKFSSYVPVKREEQTGVRRSAVISVKMPRDGNDDALRHCNDAAVLGALNTMWRSSDAAPNKGKPVLKLG
jgi:hypothetical protein